MRKVFLLMTTALFSFEAWAQTEEYRLGQVSVEHGSGLLRMRGRLQIYLRRR